MTKQPQFQNKLPWEKAYFQLGLPRRDRAAIRGPLLAMTAKPKTKKRKVFWVLIHSSFGVLGDLGALGGKQGFIRIPLSVLTINRPISTIHSCHLRRNFVIIAFFQGVSRILRFGSKNG